ncbi:VCBS repeat-containing protein [Streptomyces sp. NPDC053253]|uniref:VCBS repeat-containing protein n=1 Tax=Streptomyces sp. NPDC053253 TaxID=3365699 RepID=UPI0037CD22D7
MKPRTHPAPRRLGAAVTAVLAVAAGALTAAPATAAPTALPAAAAEAQEALLPLPTGEIVGAGTSGYLVRDARTYTTHWVRFDTGAVTKLSDTLPYFVQGSDSVVGNPDTRTTTVRDMTTGRIVLTVDDSRLYGATVWGAVGSTLFSTVADETTGHETLSLFRPVVNGTAARTVATGLPADATAIWPESLKNTSVTLAYKSGGKQYRAALDLASGTVSGAKVVVIPADALFRDPGDMSPTLRAWMTEDAAAKVSLVLEDRKTAARRSLALGQPYRPAVHVVGDWALYADDRLFMEPSPLQALRARSFAGAEFKLLDTYGHAVREPDGTLLVQGGTLDRGEGLFRIRAGADGKPVATMIAASGVPVKLALAPSTISTVDLDKNRGQANLDWSLSRLNVQVKVTLRHRRTGKTATRSIVPPYNDYVAPHIARIRWDGLLDSGERAFNGVYDWQFTATPLDKLGPAVSASGSFTVTRKVNPRDLNDNGSPDLLVREANGILTRLDTTHRTGAPDRAVVPHTIGSGWQAYDRIEATGNLDGTAVGDLVARDRAGVLWLYQGNGRGNYATRLRIGAGWQTYDKLTGGSDVTGDGRSDLLAVDKAGVLWVYPGTGDARAPFAARKRVGGGWSGYDRVAATGNLSGGAAGDLVARDRAGVLWLYLGKGDGTFAPRTRIGGGWGGYKDITGAADMNADGYNDLVGFDGLNNFMYPGTGDWKRPFEARWEVGSVPYELNLLA